MIILDYFFLKTLMDYQRLSEQDKKLVFNELAKDFIDYLENHSLSYYQQNILSRTILLNVRNAPTRDHLLSFLALLSQKYPFFQRTYLQMKDLWTQKEKQEKIMQKLQLLIQKA